VSLDTGLTCDAFLGGRLTLRQPVTGYRAGLDPVLLAAAVSMDHGEACEIGCGAGAALLAAALANPGARFTGLERDTEASRLARDNAEANDLADRVTIRETDALALAERELFDLIFTNPPFYDDPSAQRAPSLGKQQAFLADTPLADWIAASLRMLKPKGRLVMIHRAERLGDLLAALAGRAGDISVKPVSPRPQKPATRIVLSARKGAKGPLRLLAPLALHPEGAASAYRPEADALLRGRARLEL